MTKYEVLKSSIKKSFKKNESAGTISRKYVHDPQKEVVLKIIMEFADIDTADYQLRGKALAILRFFKISYTEGETNPSYKDFDIIKYGTDIPKIIENNCKWIKEELTKLGTKGDKSEDFYNVIAETIICISDFKVKSKITEDFLFFVFDFFKLSEKKATNQWIARENYWENWEGYFYIQILRIQKEMKGW
jgi:hypothetical protein